MVVILSAAKNLLIPVCYTFEILRLTPQNDVVGQLLNPPLQKGDFYDPVPVKTVEKHSFSNEPATGKACSTV